MHGNLSALRNYFSVLFGKKIVENNLYVSWKKKSAVFFVWKKIVRRTTENILHKC